MATKSDERHEGRLWLDRGSCVYLDKIFSVLAWRRSQEVPHFQTIAFNKGHGSFAQQPKREHVFNVQAMKITRLRNQRERDGRWVKRFRLAWTSPEGDQFVKYVHTPLCGASCCDAWLAA